ncbi:addiction module toxin RelE, partial [Salmonella enterica]|nr:addiction module toxin RelE [Salmonella enterica]
KSFKLHQGGKGVNPRERTLVRDWGERGKPTHMQPEV